MSLAPAAPSRDAEQAFRRMQAMLANISDTVTLVDADGQVLDTSGLHAQVMGYGSDFWQGRSIFDLVDPDDLPRLLATRELVLQRPGEQITIDVRVVQADSSWADIELTAVNLLDDPLVVGIVITSRNITARKATEAELARRRDEAVEQSRLRSELVARVSHELRNQLHALRGLTELLGEADLPWSSRRLVDSTHRQTQAFQHLVDDLLEYSRTDAARNPLRPEPTLVRQLLADAAALGRGLGADGVLVEAHSDEEVPDTVVVDGPKVRQVLANLVANAARFTVSGRIVLRVSRCGRRECVGLRWTVTDTGRGIDPSDIERIFEPFDQGSHPDRTSGVGLGLAITSGLVDLLGGRIQVDSTPGEGSRFTVEIPFEVGDELPDRPTHDAVRARGGAHVLVVEDNAVNQMLVAEQLARLGARTTVVGSGIEALDVLAGNDRIDCVLMDWQLPGLDGVETTRLHRSLEPPGERVPIIGMTASGRPSDRSACLSAGMDMMLVKPVGLLELGHALYPYIGERRSQPRAGALGAGAPADTDALDLLVDQLGSVAPVVSIVGTFLVELEHRRRAVAESIGSLDAEQLARTAHSLRSTSRTLGAIELDHLSQLLEHSSFPPDPELLGSFEAACDATRSALEGWLERIER